MAFIANIGRGIRKSVSGTTGFFRGSVQELKKVRWPSRKEMVNYTLVVLFTVIVLTAFLFAVDLGMGQLVNLITK
ncbi:preprotein translocase subunit SecE [Hazenella coriacea]|uniref:Protein translocase subunit SecE n=1 Tax=Hazenella coriacea TaxID=1179467 RepID=A0A4R3L5C9_9BACL|nr:preprotein translocase subunit SecE [Hazenella coriacea]TCS94218.1 preprotein translocase subunit SecE [Hazenella coriacea]